jgi:hypothetical protein
LLSFFSLILLEVLFYEHCEPGGLKWHQPKSDRLSVHASVQSGPVVSYTRFLNG